ncbi:MAG TPA: hypothetical protein PKE06_23230 [Flavilitoribacter sp.]|nr:hypothetical protein [Flavilitoribacter sp.]HMQ88246.1 hypothetical protein [Flavilitoribacter sp.]
MKLYQELATWWHLFSSPADYAEEAGLYWDIIARHKPDIRTALELGSGGGNNAKDTQVETEYVYLIKEADGTVRCIHDRTREGIFPRQTWQELLTNAGFQVTFEPIPHSDLEPDSYFVIVAVQGLPAAGG